MKTNMKEKAMTTRLGTTLAALLLAACGANTTVPYAIHKSPNIWISYPFEGNTQVCLSADGNNSFPVYFAAFNQPTGTTVRVRVDRHIGATPGPNENPGAGTAGPGIFTTLTNTSPAIVSLPTAQATATARHLVDVEIVNADGSALSAAQTGGMESHKYQVAFSTRNRVTVVAGTAAQAATRCPNVVACTADTDCDEGQHCVDGACESPEE